MSVRSRLDFQLRSGQSPRPQSRQSETTRVAMKSGSMIPSATPVVEDGRVRALVDVSRRLGEHEAGLRGPIRLAHPVIHTATAPERTERLPRWADARLGRGVPVLPAADALDPVAQVQQLAISLCGGRPGTGLSAPRAAIAGGAPAASGGAAASAPVPGGPGPDDPAGPDTRAVPTRRDPPPKNPLAERLGVQPQVAGQIRCPPFPPAPGRRRPRDSGGGCPPGRTVAAAKRRHPSWSGRVRCRSSSPRR
jgi:hypothetical protein